MRYQVDTDGLVAVAAHLEAISTTVDDQARVLAGVTWWPIQSVLHISVVEVTAGAAVASTLAPGLTTYALQLRLTAQHLRASAALYLAAEITVEAALVSARAMAMWLAGKALALLLLSPIGQALTLTFIAWHLAGISLAQGIANHAFGLINRPAPDLVDVWLERINWQPLIRLGIDLGGQLPFGGLPPHLLLLLDLKGASGTTAIAYLVALQLGLLRPGVFTVVDRRTTHVRDDGTPPSLGSLIDGVPPSVDGLPQVAVTTYTDGEGGHLYEIAITGTSSQSLGVGDQPFDNQGNAGTYAGVNAESVAAVLAAIEAAGVPEGATVVLTGYSQGAMVAQAIAASGRFEVEFLTTIGSPSRPDGIPDGITVIEIEHPADPIVGLQGTRPDHGDGALIVTVDPDLDPTNPKHDGPMGNHSLDAYRASAAALADSTNPAVQAAQAELAELFDGYTATNVQHLTVERADGEAPPGSLPWAVDAAGRPYEEAAEQSVEIAESLLGRRGS